MSDTIPANCTWVDGVSPADVAPMTDGRRIKGQRSRAAILSMCREFMQAGAFRPPVEAVAHKAGYSREYVYVMFKTREAFYLAALDDEETQRAILALILRDSLPPQTEGDRDRLLRAIVLGRA
jgi:AcrR family transcriptional regulator